MCIQVYTYVISYLLRKLPSYSLEHKPAIYCKFFWFWFQHHHWSWGLGYECPHLCKCLCQLKRLNLSAILSAQPSLFKFLHFLLLVPTYLFIVPIFSHIVPIFSHIVPIYPGWPHTNRPSLVIRHSDIVPVIAPVTVWHVSVSWLGRSKEFGSRFPWQHWLQCFD